MKINLRRQYGSLLVIWLPINYCTKEPGWLTWIPLSEPADMAYLSGKRPCLQGWCSWVRYPAGRLGRLQRLSLWRWIHLWIQPYPPEWYRRCRSLWYPFHATTGEIRWNNGADGKPGYRSHFMHSKWKCRTRLLQGDPWQLQDNSRTHGHYPGRITPIYFPRQRPGEHPCWSVCTGMRCSSRRSMWISNYRDRKVCADPDHGPRTSMFILLLSFSKPFSS